MQKLICDRCGRTIIPQEKAVVTIQYARYTKLSAIPVELCVPCSKELEAFLKTRKEGGRIW